MAAAAKLKLFSAPPMTPKLADDPEYAAESAKLREIAAEFDAATAALNAVTQSLDRMQTIVAKAIDDAARARLDGKQTPVRSVLVADRDELQFRVNVLREALGRQNAKLAEVRERCAAEILAEATPRHRELAREVVDLAIQLADALDRERDFRVELGREGVESAAWPRLQHFANRIGSRRCWSSPVNDLARRMADHIGRAWDHSQVRY